jgi:hypothetical protein
LYVHRSDLSLFSQLLQFIVMFRIEPIHEQTIGEYQKDKNNDAALVSKPETQRKGGSRQLIMIESVRK